MKTAQWLDVRRARTPMIIVATDITPQSENDTKKEHTSDSGLAEALRRALLHPTNGIVGLVDELLKLCPESGLELDWQDESCRAYTFENHRELMEVPLRKSVFRAILARVAAICNDRNANAVSPYGGVGELSVVAHPATVLRVSFVNTTAEQRLTLTRATAPSRDAEALQSERGRAR